MSFDEYVMTCMYHSGIIHSILIAPKILHALPIYTSFTSQPLDITDFFSTFPIVLSFPECHIVRIIQYIAFLRSFFYLLMYFWVSSLSFHDFVAHIFLAPNNISL